MKLIATMPVRNESWCLGLSLRVALLWNDVVVVGLHACTDRSKEITLEVAHENAGRVVIQEVSDPCWHEMEQRQALLTTARQLEATHISIVDADELLTGNLADEMHLHFYQEDQGLIMQLPGYNLRGSLTRYHSNGVWGNRWFSVVFKDDPVLNWNGDRFHAREPQGKPLQPYRPIQQGDGGVIHLWGLSERRLRAKHALYKVTERLRWPDRSVESIDYEYSLCVKGDPRNRPAYGTPETWTYASTPASWTEPYSQWIKYLDIHQIPWQEKAVEDAIAEHGKERFAGLDLLGVV